VRTDELDYALPEELIAQRPAERRDDSRLLVQRRDTGIEHRRFADLPDLLEPSDLVVVNSSRVMRARVAVRRPSGGGGEVLLLEERGDGLWEALVRPSRRIRPGAALTAAAGELAIEPVEALGEGRWLVRPSLAGAELEHALETAGSLPLPPYVRDPSVPDERYQTVYARQPGSAAAPTAGLHFTPELWARVQARCEVAEVELRVGLDTFRPVTTLTLEEHPMHSEAYRVTPAARAAIAAAVAAGRRVVCIGTTSVRAVETIADPAAPDEGRTSLLIAPGYRFAAVSALVTNFHLPRSTLLALVMAFCGVEETRRIYAEAIRERYRFYSFGDASLLAGRERPL
jgi:S-adenosylmethionine:tRNA ribosyltransferase-isomerase